MQINKNSQIIIEITIIKGFKVYIYDSQTDIFNAKNLLNGGESVE